MLHNASYTTASGGQLLTAMYDGLLLPATNARFSLLNILL